MNISAINKLEIKKKKEYYQDTINHFHISTKYKFTDLAIRIYMYIRIIIKTIKLEIKFCNLVTLVTFDQFRRQSCAQAQQFFNRPAGCANGHRLCVISSGYTSYLMAIETRNIEDGAGISTPGTKNICSLHWTPSFSKVSLNTRE